MNFPMIWLLLVIPSLAANVGSLESDTYIRQPGYCAMYGNCGKKSFFGSQLPCPANIKAVKPPEESIDILTRVCGEDFPVERVCCSTEQLLNLESSLKRVDPLISSCPACRKNFYDFICKFTCSADQSTFLSVVNTASSIDTHEEIITELNQFVDPEYASDFYDSCKDLKFSATNGYAMDLIGGGAKNYSQFLKFLGDEKPLLGGSPFQLNFKFDLNKTEAKSGLALRSGDMKACDDPDYKCACSDCPTSCPSLPEFKDFKQKCSVVGLPCFSFTIIVIWVLLILALGAYHIHLARTKRARLALLNSILEGEDDSDSRPQSKNSFTLNSPKLRVFTNKLFQWKLKQISLISNIEILFTRIGLFCASFPGITIGFSLATTILLSSGLTHLELEKNPINLWVSPSEPALKNLQYYEEKFGEWFRIEQIIISNKNKSDPILNWDTVQWWFDKELELHTLKNKEGKDLALDSFCFKPLGETCAIQSFTQYFQGNIQYLNEKTWASNLKHCTESPVDCLPTFQQPLKKNILFSDDDAINSRAFVVTILLNSNLKDKNYSEEVTEYEHALQEWIFELKQQNPHVSIDFSTEVSLEEELNKSTNTDIKIVVISYVIMFIYASIALGGKIPTSAKLKTLVLTRFLLGLSGIIIILLSVSSSAGLFSFFGVKSTLIIAEVIPFMVLAIGIDNIFLIVHELHIINESSEEFVSIEARCAQALGNVGPSCLISAVLQISMFLLASTVQMPAVRNFAIYSAGAITFNFLLQMTGFVSLLALDQHRLENGKIDCIPCIRAESDSIILPDEEQYNEHIEYDFSHLIEKYYAPWLFKPSNKRKILTFFLVWLGVSLSLLPGIQFGLDQRLAIPQGSYLIDYFNSIYEYLNVGPPVFFVVKDSNVTARDIQQKLCGKFSTCDEFSLANILEQEYKRGEMSTISEPTSNWLDDFLTWLNPNLDQCCRFKKETGSSPSVFEREFCKPNAPERQCETCYLNHDPPYSTSMEGFPVGDEFITYFNQWIQEPSDPCPLGGKAPYSSTISLNKNNTNIKASYFRTSHTPLRSQDDFINAYRNSLRITKEIQEYEDLDVFPFSPFYVFFVQYQSIVSLTVKLLILAFIFIWVISVLLLGSVQAATVLIATVIMIIINIGGVLSLWSISLNAVSLVNLVICVGLAVEFTIHITRAYVVSDNKDEESENSLFDSFMSSSTHNLSFITDVKIWKAYRALVKVGGSVLGGITITKFIGISILAFTQSKIFEVYYFRMWLSLVVIAAVHSLVLLPILLSYFGGYQNLSPKLNPEDESD